MDRREWKGEEKCRECRCGERGLIVKNWRSVARLDGWREWKGCSEGRVQWDGGMEWEGGMRVSVKVGELKCGMWTYVGKGSRCRGKVREARREDGWRI